MKYLGVDYGSKKIGIAISDEGGVFAFPKKIITFDKNNSHIDEIEVLCQKEDIENIVIGKSVDYQNKNNNIEKDIEKFITLLNKEGKYIIHRIDERLSTSLVSTQNRFHFQKNQNPKNFSKNAKSVRENSKDDDAKVASVILQSFLDSKDNL
jgi:putative Holliday junction resolvase